VRARHYDQTAIAAPFKAWRLLLLTKGGEHTQRRAGADGRRTTRERTPFIIDCTVNGSSAGDNTASLEFHVGDGNDRYWPILLKNSKMHPVQFLAKLNRDRQFAL